MDNKKKFYISTVLFILILSASAYALQSERTEKLAQESSGQNRQSGLSSYGSAGGKNNSEEQTGETDNITDKNIILYYSESCPHCKNVEKYIEENGIKGKVAFIEKEVAKNSQNAEEMFGKAKACNIPAKTVGIPFLWDGENGNKCLMGDIDIIQYFKTKANIQ